MQISIIRQAAITIKNQCAILAWQSILVTNCARCASGGGKSGNAQRVTRVRVGVLAAHVAVYHIACELHADHDIAAIIIGCGRVINAGDCDCRGVLCRCCAVRDIIGDQNIDALAIIERVQQARVNSQIITINRDCAIG